MSLLRRNSAVGQTKRSNGPTSWMVISEVALAVLIIVALYLFSKTGGDLFQRGMGQALLGTLMIVVAVILLVTVYSQLRLTSETDALGLPRGSVRALIAFIFIVVFLIFSSVIFRAINGEPRQVQFSGLTQSELAALPGPVVSKSALPVPSASPSAASPTPSYAGAYQTDATNPEARTVGTQIITALITLITAVSGFYFGTGKIKDALRAATRRLTLAVQKPGNNYQLSRDAGGNWQPVDIVLGGTALQTGAANLKIDNDREDAVVTQDGTNYTYQPTNPQAPVTITFTATEDSSVTASLSLRLPPPPGGGP